MAATDTNKLKELILYIAEQSEGDPRFGKTKLFKILFYADFICYMQSGHSITGGLYRKAPFGPLAVDGDAALTALQDDEALAIARRQYHGKAQLRPVALREPALESFSAPEIDLVNDVIRDLWEQNATEVSRLSHDFIGWQAAAMDEIIPYEASLIDTSPLTVEEEEWARQFALVPA
jgi:hypothetical protein